MVIGIFWAILAGVMLGLYALPEKFAKDFEFENTWGTFFTTALFIVPFIAAFGLINGFGGVLASLPVNIYIKMGVASVLWGVGVMLWGKAINHIGLSLGFSIFIGTVILVGSLLPFIEDGVPETKQLITILIGILVVLVGIIANGKAGMQREADEKGSDTQVDNAGTMATGILISVIGGLLATGFSYANAAGRPAIHELCQAAGNPEWVTAIGVMFIIYVAGGLFVTPYFIIQLSKKNLWGKFKTPNLGRNLTLTSTMAVLNFFASAVFALAALTLGAAGNTVGYAIFNTISIVVAILSGLLTKEWVNASAKAKKSLYLGLACMCVGVLIIAIGNGMA